MKPELATNERTIRVHVPLALKRRGGRKLIIAPAGASDWATPVPRIDDTLLKALARAWRWRGMIEGGKVHTVRHLAEKEKISSSYVARILRLTLVEAARAEKRGAQFQHDSLQAPVGGDEQSQFVLGDVIPDDGGMWPAHGRRWDEAADLKRDLSRSIDALPLRMSALCARLAVDTVTEASREGSPRIAGDRRSGAHPVAVRPRRRKLAPCLMKS